MKVVALAGGTGSAKILRGLQKVTHDLTVIANVGDNIWMHGLYICPDLDIAMYTLAGLEDKKMGWGVEGDTYSALSQLKRLGEPSWFKLGDIDLATHIARTRMLRDGKSLTQATSLLSQALGIRPALLPVTDDPLETHIITPAGSMHLQEFWVRRRGRPRVTGVEYRGAASSSPTLRVEGAIKVADRVVVCPANPVTSVSPMLAVPGFVRMLQASKARVAALSPMVGSAPFSGPAGKMMRGLGFSPDSVGVARAYSAFADALLVARSDRRMRVAVEESGPTCVLTETRIAGPDDEVRLARELLAA